MTHNSPPLLRDRLLAGIVSLLGWAVLHLIGKTSRLNRRFHPDALALYRSGKPFIYALWHRYQLLLAYVHRGEGVQVLISRSRDGEFIARTVERLGYRSIRGSSSRGGVAALREALDALDGGGRVVFTPDGPRGPAGVVQPGVVAAAQRTGAPILPVAWTGSNAVAVDSWDRFLIPRPFGRCEIVYGAPVTLAPDDPSPEERLRAALDAVARDAERHLRGGKA